MGHCGKQRVFANEQAKRQASDVQKTRATDENANTRANARDCIDGSIEYEAFAHGRRRPFPHARRPLRKR